MTEYRLTIVKVERNEHYEEQYGKWEQGQRSAGWRTGPNAEPQPYNELRALVCMITDEEWEAVKQALVAHWS